jgi:hypothetical protein
MKWHNTKLSNVYITFLSLCADQTLNCFTGYFFSPIPYLLFFLKVYMVRQLLAFVESSMFFHSVIQFLATQGKNFFYCYWFIGFKVFSLPPPPHIRKYIQQSTV